MQSEPQEINIAFIISVILAKKREAILIFGIVFFMGIALTFILPRKYQAIEILRLGMVNKEQVETIDALKMLFQSEAKLNEIADELGLPPPDVEKNFSIESRDKGRFVLIRGQGKSPEEAMKITKLISREILSREERLYLPVQEKFEAEIIALEKEKESIGQRIDHQEKTINDLEADIAFYQKEVAKRVDAQSEDQGRIVSTYIKLLSETKKARDEAVNELMVFQKDLPFLESEILEKNSARSYLSNPPGVEMQAFMPKKSFIPVNIVQNMIYFAILGIFLAVIWVFIRTFHIKQQAA
ncbi:MAG: hypothetical protein FJZ07_00390 [Candidatus Nealsonbacteria bacterium]|nr:hypothetical protein [Candidatus Nealsonbacteria bacterium]